MTSRWGSAPTADRADVPATPGRADLVTAPTRGDEIATAASEVIGGPVGRYAVRLVRGWRYYAALLAGASAVVSGLGVLLRAPCIDTGWSSPDQFWHACFSDLPATYRDAGLSAGIGAYLSGGFGSPAPTQPPLTSFLMTLTATVVPSGETPDRMRFYFAIWTIAAAVLWALTTWWTAATVRRFPLRAAQVALAPVALLVLPISADVVGVALTAAGPVCVDPPKARGRRGAARARGVSAHLPARRHRRAAVRLPSGRAGDGVAAHRGRRGGGGRRDPLRARCGEPRRGLRRIPVLAGRGCGLRVAVAAPAARRPAAVADDGDVLCVAGWVVALVVGAGFTLAMPRRPGVAEVSLVMLAIVMLTGKSMTVQSALWLVPFAALVGLAWKDVLAWSATEALHFEAVWLYLAGTSAPSRGLPASWYAVFLVIRLGGVLWLLARTWQLALGRPPVYDEEGAVVESDWGDERERRAGRPVARRPGPARRAVRLTRTSEAAEHPLAGSEGAVPRIQEHHEVEDGHDQPGQDERADGGAQRPCDERCQGAGQERVDRADEEVGAAEDVDQRDGGGRPACTSASAPPRRGGSR